MFLIGPFFRDLWNWDIPELEDVSQLKDKGEYSEETEERDGLVIKRIRFTGTDGSRIYREVSTPKGLEKYQQLWDIQSRLQRAVREENFSEAVKLKDERDALKKELPALNKPKKLKEGK
jgi:hypothetical protein